MLVSSSWEGRRNIMPWAGTPSLEFSPPLVGCLIASGNRSFELMRQSPECVINLPTTALLDALVGIDLTPEVVEGAAALTVRECHAHFACWLHDDNLVEKSNFFIWEVVTARAVRTLEHPGTMLQETSIKG